MVGTLEPVHWGGRKGADSLLLPLGVVRKRLPHHRSRLTHSVETLVCIRPRVPGECERRGGMVCESKHDLETVEAPGLFCTPDLRLLLSASPFVRTRVSTSGDLAKWGTDTHGGLGGLRTLHVLLTTGRDPRKINGL